MNKLKELLDTVISNKKRLSFRVDKGVNDYFNSYVIVLMLMGLSVVDGYPVSSNDLFANHAAICACLIVLRLISLMVSNSNELTSIKVSTYIFGIGTSFMSMQQAMAAFTESFAAAFVTAYIFARICIKLHERILCEIEVFMDRKFSGCEKR